MTDTLTSMDNEQLGRFRTRICYNKSTSGRCDVQEKCPFSHCLSWHRRNPYEYAYRPTLCPNVNFSTQGGRMRVKNYCRRGRTCMFSHTKEEQMYHPMVYKTQQCRDFPSCKKHFCPFAHGLEDLRDPEEVGFRCIQGPEILVNIEEHERNAKEAPPPRLSTPVSALPSPPQQSNTRPTPRKLQGPEPKKQEVEWQPRTPVPSTITSPSQLHRDTSMGNLSGPLSETAKSWNIGVVPASGDLSPTTAGSSYNMVRNSSSKFNGSPRDPLSHCGSPPSLPGLSEGYSPVESPLEGILFPSPDCATSNGKGPSKIGDLVMGGDGSVYVKLSDPIQSSLLNKQPEAAQSQDIDMYSRAMISAMGLDPSILDLSTSVSPNEGQRMPPPGLRRFENIFNTDINITDSLFGDGNQGSSLFFTPEFPRHIENEVARAENINQAPNIDDLPFLSIGNGMYENSKLEDLLAVPNTIQSQNAVSEYVWESIQRAFATKAD